MKKRRKNYSSVLTSKEAGEYLNISFRLIQKKCRNGELKSYREGRKFIIPIDSLEEYIKNRLNSN